MAMADDRPLSWQPALKRLVHALLGLSTFRFAVLFLSAAVIVSVMVVLAIDLFWDGRLNAELEFAGVVTPLLDGLLLIVIVTAMLNETREEMERRQTAEQLMTKERDFSRALIDSLPGIFYVISDKGEYVRWNRNLETVSEYSPAELARMQPLDFFVGKERELIAEKVREVFTTGKTSVEATLVSKSGREYPHGFTGVRVLLDGEAYLVGVGVDLSEHRKTEEALLESERKFRAVFDHTFQFIGLMTIDGVLIEANRTALRLSGVEEADVLGKPFWETPWWQHSPDMQRELRLAVSEAGKGKLVRFEATHPTADGTLIWVDFSLTPVRDENGTVTYLIPEGRDITERKRIEERYLKLNDELELKVQERTRELVAMQQELVHREKLSMLGLIAGGMGNELRNPLGVMNNAVFYLKSVLPDAEESVKEYLDIIKQEIDNAYEIISDLLDFSRIKQPRPSPLAPLELITTCIKKFSFPGNVEVLLDCPATLAAIMVDQSQMGQVLQHLIGNALQAMPGGGRLQISARRIERLAGDAEDAGSRSQQTEENSFARRPHPPLPDAAAIAISIEDSGEGIAADNMEKIFTPLFTTKSRGIGLGLALAKKYTEANGGRIEVTSRLGRGTTFTLLLPVEGG
jgi:PAS domain S-box-containing protein